ncbi:MAG: BolA family transcriptional regulator [Myxococcales bacterium]|nr:BolA family transcriptional regulator [Myxococcales bacterium]MCB9566383.1 BolA family transcriptional regulator [Myxococcales bacterium]MCB9705759.1 BolA family transcriptional regulator [Myxococcales bacterium]
MSGPVEAAITAKLAALDPAHLEVINQSHQHSVAPGSETHFKVVIVAEGFAGEMLVARHRRVHALLADELAGGVHALSIEALTPAQWEARGGAIRPSPPCLGGSKAG